MEDMEETEGRRRDGQRAVEETEGLGGTEGCRWERGPYKVQRAIEEI
jgi:hypothetical protein